LTWVGGFDRTWIGTAVLLAALPPTAGIIAVAKDYGIEAGRVALTVLAAAVAAIATLPLTLAVVGNGTVPAAPLG
jgi:predicted permease